MSCESAFIAITTVVWVLAFARYDRSNMSNGQETKALVERIQFLETIHTVVALGPILDPSKVDRYDHLAELARLLRDDRLKLLEVIEKHGAHVFHGRGP